MKFSRIFIMVLAVGVSYLLVACGQRLALEQPEGAVQDSKAY
jgi:hypothetical protein